MEVRFFRVPTLTSVFFGLAGIPPAERFGQGELSRSRHSSGSVFQSAPFSVRAGSAAVSGALSGCNNSGKNGQQRPRRQRRPRETHTGWGLRRPSQKHNKEPRSPAGTGRQKQEQTRLPLTENKRTRPMSAEVSFKILRASKDACKDLSNDVSSRSNVCHQWWTSDRVLKSKKNIYIRFTQKL